MAVSIRRFLVEPEAYALMFFVANVMVLIFALNSLVSWPYTLVYLAAHMAIFLFGNRRLSAGRFYAPTKNLKNQTVIVTGAAAGIGRMTAVELAKLRARVIIGVRGQERAERVAAELSSESNGNVVGYHLDLSDLASVKAFAEKIDQVNILINNAGVAKQQRELTKDGLEATFGTNHSESVFFDEVMDSNL